MHLFVYGQFEKQDGAVYDKLSSAMYTSETFGSTVSRLRNTSCHQVACVCVYRGGRPKTSLFQTSRWIPCTGHQRVHLMGSAVVSTWGLPLFPHSKDRMTAKRPMLERYNSWCFADGQPASFFLGCVILYFVDLPVHCCTFSGGP